MLLSNCKVVDGKGEEYQLIDSNGCTTDEYLFPQITYSKDVTTAMVQTAAFNFPDRNTMYFNCKIRLCLKSDNCAAITVSDKPRFFSCERRFWLRAACNEPKNCCELICKRFLAAAMRRQKRPTNDDRRNA